MWYWLLATAKAHATPETIAAKRHQWVAQGKDGELAKRCRTAQRYVVEGASPTKVLWLLDTDAPDAVQLITDHFGDLWDIEVVQVTPQSMAQAGPK
ncbi:MAG: hypothetical protein HY353_03100 [Candidatus Omnitrophica bacterium]|nr:hypothetical protein [Candidatus Omnitrophota bacterium]